MAWRLSAAKIYRALLLAYPAEFRHEYGPEMERLFGDRSRTEPRIRLWLESLADIALSAPKEHLHILAADLRYGARMFSRAPGFTFVALSVMALGIGATTRVHALLWRELGRLLRRVAAYGGQADERQAPAD
ncbi:MAG TPA: hypothetical protein VLI55_06765 [Bryobacteraceae bacterium]|nr:hypothetical protein [Bryobacteraceae bacterium]